MNTRQLGLDDTRKAFLLILSAIAFGMALYYAHQKWPLYGQLQDGRTIPPHGVAANPNSQAPVHPEEVEDDFKKLYGAILEFRRVKGHLPRAAGGKDLLQFAKEGGPSVTEEDLIAADALLSDNYAQGMRDHLDYWFCMRAPRPGQKPKPDFPKNDERDAWVCSSDYERANTTIYANGTAKSKASGFFIVLWSDGAIERISVDDVQWVGEKDGLTLHFPGQADLPRNTVSGKRWNKLTESAVPEGMVKTGPNTRRSNTPVVK